MRACTLALLLLWLTLTGSYAGWKSPLLWVNVVGWGLLLAWMIGQAAKNSLGRVETAMMLFITALLASAIITGAGIGRIAVWFAYLGFYYLGSHWTDDEIHRAAALALVPYGLASFLPWENPNVIAFNLLGLILLAAPALDWKLYSPFYILLAWPLNSVGGCLAGLIGTLGYASRITHHALLLIPLMAMGAWLNPVGCFYRLQFWAEAWRNFLLFPIWGIGPGNYHLAGWWHAHNIVATIAAETGLIGLAGVSLLIWTIARRWLTLPAWAAAVVLAYGAWSLVDEPLHFWGAAFIFFLALSRPPIPPEGGKERKEKVWN